MPKPVQIIVVKEKSIRRFRIASNSGAIQNEKGDEKYQRGDYILQDLDGREHVNKPKEFIENYRILPDGKTAETLEKMRMARLCTQAERVPNERYGAKEATPGDWIISIPKDSVKGKGGKSSESNAARSDSDSYPITCEYFRSRYKYQVGYKDQPVYEISNVDLFRICQILKDISQKKPAVNALPELYSIDQNSRFLVEFKKIFPDVIHKSRGRESSWELGPKAAEFIKEAERLLADLKNFTERFDLTNSTLLPLRDAPISIAMAIGVSACLAGSVMQRAQSAVVDGTPRITVARAATIASDLLEKRVDLSIVFGYPSYLSNDFDSSAVYQVGVGFFSVKCKIFGIKDALKYEPLLLPKEKGGEGEQVGNLGDALFAYLTDVADSESEKKEKARIMSCVNWIDSYSLASDLGRAGAGIFPVIIPFEKGAKSRFDSIRKAALDYAKKNGLNLIDIARGDSCTFEVRAFYLKSRASEKLIRNFLDES